MHNCKIVMLNKGLTPGNVVAATPELITMLIANSTSVIGADEHHSESVSEQQQRLRI